MKFSAMFNAQNINRSLVLLLLNTFSGFFLFVSGCGVGEESHQDSAFVISFDHGEDFGRVATGSTITRRVRILNQSSHYASMDLQRVSCSCVSVEPEKLKIPPGTHADVSVFVRVMGVSGAQRHAAVLSLSQENTVDRANSSISVIENEIPVVFSFTADLAYTVQPEFLRISAPSNEEFRRVILFSLPDSVEKDTIRIRAVSSVPQVATKVLPNDSYRGAVQIEVVGVAGEYGDVVNGTILIKIDGYQDSTIELPVAIESLSRIIADPPSIAWRRSSADAKRLPMRYDFSVELNGVRREDLPLTLSLVSHGVEYAEFPLQAQVDGTRIVGSISSRMHTNGFVTMNVLSSEGVLLTDIPISWIAD